MPNRVMLMTCFIRPTTRQLTLLPVNKETVFDLIKAYQGWNITKGDSNVVIGVIDTGVKMDHPDLQKNLKRNAADPVNGIDDDNNGFVDDYEGWDFSNNDNGAAPPATSWSSGFDAPHGTVMAGVSSAITDNATGIASVGFNCRYIPIKVYGDNGGLFAGLRGCFVCCPEGL